MSAAGWQRVFLVLGAGNALGAFQGGAYQALHERGLLPDLVAGSSIGAVNAAIVATNRPQDRLACLREFWAGLALPGFGGTAALQARLLGRPGLFLPTADGQGFYTLSPLIQSMARLARLREPERWVSRLAVQTTDLHSGEPLIFDSRDAAAITDLHIRASCALPPDFAPVAVGDRLLCDGAMSASLPLSAALRSFARENTLCVAVDLFDRQDRRPQSLASAYTRRIDLLLSAQAARDLENLRLRHQQTDRAGRVLIVHVVRRASAEPSFDKMFDFSATMIAERWRSGHAAVRAVLDELPEPADCPAWSVIRP